MKKQAFNPYLPSWEYIPDGEPYVLAIAYMFTDPMITLTDMFSAWETMCAGQLRSMTWATGDMRV